MLSTKRFQTDDFDANTSRIITKKPCLISSVFTKYA